MLRTQRLLPRHLLLPGEAIAPRSQAGPGSRQEHTCERLATSAGTARPASRTFPSNARKKRNGTRGASRRRCPSIPAGYFLEIIELRSADDLPRILHVVIDDAVTGHVGQGGHRSGRVHAGVL